MAGTVENYEPKQLEDLEVGEIRDRELEQTVALHGGHVVVVTVDQLSAEQRDLQIEWHTTPEHEPPTGGGNGYN